MSGPAAGELPGGVANVRDRLAELWREASADDQAVIRACTLNLVVVCEDRDDRAAASRAVATLSEQHPGRALVVSTGDADRGDAPPGLRVYVSTHCHRGPEGKQVCSEQITLETIGDGGKLVPGSLLQLVVGDCPVYVWWRRRRLADDPLRGPLADMADRFVVDSTASETPGEDLAALRDIAGAARGAAVDLAWGRLEPWRDLVASLFDEPHARPCLAAIDGVTVWSGGPARADGRTVAAAYLEGWLASRLGWKRLGDGSGWRRADGGVARFDSREEPGARRGRIVTIRIEASPGGRAAVFEARRPSPTSDVARLSVKIDESCPLPRVVRVEPPADVSLLGSLLRGPRDAVFAAALAAAGD